MQSVRLTRGYERCVRSKDKEITVKEKTEGVERLLTPAKKTEQLIQKFIIRNDGPGLMPLIDVQVLLPHINDSFGIVASQTVTVSYNWRCTGCDYFRLRPEPDLAGFRNSNPTGFGAGFEQNLFSDHRTIRQYAW